MRALKSALPRASENGARNSVLKGHQESKLFRRPAKTETFPVNLHLSHLQEGISGNTVLDVYVFLADD